MPSSIDFVPASVRVAVVSIFLACLTIAAKLLLVWASRGRFASEDKKRLQNEDYLIWSDFTVTGLVAFTFLLSSKNNHNVLHNWQIWVLCGLGAAGLAILPGRVNDHVYDKKCEVNDIRKVWIANLGGFVLLTVAVGLGAEVHG